MTEHFQALSYHNFSKLSGKRSKQVWSKHFGMISWKLSTPVNIGLRSMIYILNESYNNMQLADEVSFEI